MSHDKSPYAIFSHNALRIAVGIIFFTIGASKLFGWFGGFGPDGGTAELMGRFGIAGILETFGGILIALGLFTRPTAFILSGQMAVAYFWIHVAGNGSLWWWSNGGERAMLYSFIFLALSALGAGTLSLDAKIAQRKAGAAPTD
ncbi:MAG: DoxX family protein [Gemmatimonadota bacterium]|nr:DoxX family protein [Gemmatimonadota bacterium]